MEPVYRQERWSGSKGIKKVVPMKKFLHRLRIARLKNPSVKRRVRVSREKKRET